MSIEQTWAMATEKRLVREAGGMGELLEQFRDYVSPRLVGAREWERLVARVRELPVTMAAFPFGFEVPLHDLRPGADFGVSLVGGSRTAELFQEMVRSGKADPATAGVARFLDETDREESPLRRIAGRKLLLEYDIDSAAPGEAPEPGIFLYPVGEALAGGGSGGQLEDIGALLDALDSGANRKADDRERRQVESVYRALDHGAHVGAAGTFPSRRRMVRLALMGFRRAPAVSEFLARAGWPGQCSLVDSTLAPLEERGAFARVGVHLDVHEDGLGPTLGLSLYAREGQWVKGKEHWTAMIDGIREAGIAAPEKLAELYNWAAGSQPLSGKSGPFVMVRGIHHLKITLSGNRIGPVKGYIFMLLFSWPLELPPTEPE